VRLDIGNAAPPLNSGGCLTTRPTLDVQRGRVRRDRTRPRGSCYAIGGVGELSSGLRGIRASAALEAAWPAPGRRCNGTVGYQNSPNASFTDLPTGGDQICPVMATVRLVEAMARLLVTLCDGWVVRAGRARLVAVGNRRLGGGSAGGDGPVVRVRLAGLWLLGFCWAPVAGCSVWRLTGGRDDGDLVVEQVGERDGLVAFTELGGPGRPGFHDRISLMVRSRLAGLGPGGAEGYRGCWV
jgi:hypothetical protein